MVNIIRHFHYIGIDTTSLAGENHLGLDPDTPVSLIGESAMGQMIDGVFKVQVNRFTHPWSHFWHETPREDWSAQ